MFNGNSGFWVLWKETFRVDWGEKIEKRSVHSYQNNTDSKERASVELNLSEIGWKDSQLIEKIGSDTGLWNQPCCMQDRQGCVMKKLGKKDRFCIVKEEYYSQVLGEVGY